MDTSELNAQIDISYSTSGITASGGYIHTPSVYDQLKKILSPFIESKLSILFLIFSLSIPLVYELLGSIITHQEEYLENTHHYFVFDNYLTVWLQNTFGTTNSIVGIISAYLYAFQMILMSAFAYFIFIIYLFFRQKQYRRREPWVYLAITLAMFSVNLLAFVLFPTAPPIRTTASLQYRIAILPQAESAITIKYNSFPSGHIWSTVVPYLASRAEGMVDSSKIFSISTVITSWVILMTGDHYFIDVIGSFVFSVGFFILFTSVYDYYHKKNKNPKMTNITIDKGELFKRMLLLLLLVVMGIATIQFFNSLFFVAQLLIIFILWPIIAFKYNFAQSIYKFPPPLRRDFITDIKDFLSQISDLITTVL